MICEKWREGINISFRTVKFMKYLLSFFSPQSRENVTFAAKSKINLYVDIFNGAKRRERSTRPVTTNISYTFCLVFMLSKQITPKNIPPPSCFMSAYSFDFFMQTCSLELRKTAAGSCELILNSLYRRGHCDTCIPVWVLFSPFFFNWIYVALRDEMPDSVHSNNSARVWSSQEHCLLCMFRAPLHH